MRDAGIEPGTIDSIVWSTVNETPHLHHIYILFFFFCGGFWGLQRKQQAEAAAAHAAAPTSAAPCVQRQKQTAVAVNAAPAAPLAALAASSAAAATASTIASPTRSRAVLSIKNAVRRETRSVSKKMKVESPSDSDPATPEGGSVTLLSQLDGAAWSPTTPDPKKPLPDGGDWYTAKAPRRNPR